MINTVLTPLLIIMVGFSSSISFAEENYVPNWIKDTAGFWAENKISDQDFLQSLQYLIDNDFILIPHDENLTFGSTRGISNLMEKHTVHIKLTDGLLLAVHTPGKLKEN